MKDCTPLFSNNSIPKAEKALEKMFNATRNNNEICIPTFFNEQDDTDMIICRMNWAKDDFNNIITEYRKVVEGIKEISKQYKSLQDVYEKEDLILSNELQRIFDTYLASVKLTDEVMEKMNKMYSLDIGETLSKEDIEFRNIQFKKIEQELTNRIGGKYCASDVSYAANRIAKNYFLNSPQKIIDKEISYFAQALAINKFCTAFAKY